MAIEKSKFTFMGVSSDLLTFDVRFTRDTDVKGKPNQAVNSGVIKVLVESTSDTSYSAQAYNAASGSSGSALIINPADNSKLKECSFTEGYIINLTEGKATGDTDALTIEMTISAKSITYGNARQVNNWTS